MHRTFAVLPLAIALAVPTVGVLPVIDLSADPHPVSPDINSLALQTAPELGAHTVELSQDTDEPFDLVAISWDNPQQVPGEVEVSVREAGQWQPWESLGVADSAPDLASAEGSDLRGATEPLMSSGADGVRVRASFAQTAPTDLRVDLVSAGVSAADGQASQTGAISTAAASAETSTPPIVTRAAWGADEGLRLGVCPEGPNYTGPLQAAFIHHTASSNDYNQTTAYQQLRALYAYFVNSRGYCDIAYNFLVDKFGTIYEGRAGGIDAEVLGAHTGGFNRDSFAVSALGNFDVAGAPAAMVESMGAIAGWKLGRYGRNPFGSTVLVASAGAGTTSKYPEGTAVTVPVISPHQAVGATACPGQYLVPGLDRIRQVASQWSGVTPAKPAPASERNYVAEVYRDFLGREADAGGLEFWSGALYRRNMTRTQFVDAFVRSPEWTQLVVRGLYTDLLGRPADPNGLAVLSARLRTDAYAAPLVTLAFLVSDEYYNKSGATPELFVTQLYRDLLGRAPDPAGLTGWAATVRASGRLAVAGPIYRSPESLTRRITAGYEHLLDRQPEPGGIAYWSPIVASLGDLILDVNLATSLEYFNRAQ